MTLKGLLPFIFRRIHILSVSPNPEPSLSLPHSLLYGCSISSSPTQNPQNTEPRPRTRTPLEKQFETWVEKLKPGFTPFDVDEALRAKSDPDLALDIFRWTAQQRGYKHNHVTYLTMIKQLISCRRYRQAETLVEEFESVAAMVKLDGHDITSVGTCNDAEGEEFSCSRGLSILTPMKRAFGEICNYDYEGIKNGDMSTNLENKKIKEKP